MLAMGAASATNCVPATTPNTKGTTQNAQLEVAEDGCNYLKNGVTATNYPFTPLTPMQSGLTVASAQALTVPAGATYAVVCAYGQAVNYTTDGTTTPTGTATGTGMQLAAGSCLALSGPLVIANFKAIQQSATATLSASYFK
jgi:hypothetical protein